MLLLGIAGVAFAVAAAVAFGGGGVRRLLPASDADKVRWATQLKAVLADALPQLSPAARDLILIQAAYESGFGTSTASSAYNFWNLTRAPSDTRATLEGGDTAYDAAGNLLGSIVQRFRAYASPLEGAKDYLAFVSTPHYAIAALQLRDGSEYGFLSALSSAGFFTLPLVKYASGFSAARGDLVRLGVIS